MAEAESSRGPSLMVRVMDSASGPAAIPRLLAAGSLQVAGKRYSVLKDAVARPQAVPTEGPEPAERTFRALQRSAEDGIGP
eukprot:8166687-Alexandrium_andersonii.AAC.1